MANSEINLASVAQDVKGRPMFEWKLDPTQKIETLTKHAEDGTDERVKEKQVDETEIDHAKFTEFVKDESQVTKECVQ